MPIEPYLFFNGHCEEAVEYYRKTLGAELEMLMRFGESPEPAPGLPAGWDRKVMHASLRIAASRVMASDGMSSGPPSFSGISLSLTVPDEATADRLFNALAEEGRVEMPIGKTFFAPRFGAVADRFGVSWMIIAEDPAHRG